MSMKEVVGLRIRHINETFTYHESVFIVTLKFRCNLSTVLQSLECSDRHYQLQIIRMLAMFAACFLELQEKNGWPT